MENDERQADAYLIVEGDDTQKETEGVVAQGYDFDVESDRVAYCYEALLGSRLSPFDDNTEAFKNPFANLSACTVDKLVATFLEISEPIRKQSRAMCEDMQRRHLGGFAEERNPLF